MGSIVRSIAEPMAQQMGGTFGTLTIPTNVAPDAATLKAAEDKKKALERKADRETRSILKSRKPGRDQLILTDQDSSFPYRLF